MKAIIDSLRIGPEKNFCYLIACPTTKKAGLIDPAFEFDRVIEWVHSHGRDLEIQYLIATHGHWDHAGGFPEMLKRIPKAQVVIQTLEEKRIQKAGIPVHKKLEDGETFNIGHVQVKAIHSPGHTEGGCCYVVENQIFTGDTLFVGQCGRTDLEGGSDEKLFSSLQRLKSLDGEMLVRPGHDYGKTPTSTISDETKSNPTMKAKTVEEFKSLP